MPDIAAVQRFLQWLTIGAYAVLLLKIYACKELHHYRYFTFYLIVQFARSLVLASMKSGTMAYGWIFLITAPLIWVCYILVVIELYSLILSSYQGIATFGRYTLASALALSVLVSAGTLLFDFANGAESFPILLAAFAIERLLVSSLALLLIAVTGFLLWFPVPLRRNVVIYSLVYFVYFLSKAGALLIRNTGGPAALQILNTTVLSAASICLVSWVFFLNREGEQETVKSRPQWKPETERRLLEQLDSINAALLRSTRK
jgi:hypothetical protein